MVSKPTVSMLIISFNEREYLQQAVQSCENQTYPNLEIIIGDDGSSDGSLDMIQSMRDRVRFFVMSRDGVGKDVIPSIRVSNIIKRGLDEATGDYFSILSGDDFYTDNQFVEEAVAYLESHKRDVAYVGGFHYADQSGNLTATVVPKRKAPWIYWSGSYTHISCFVFRKMDSKELLARMCDDTGLQYILAAKGGWGYSGKPVMAYRQREQSIQHESDLLEQSLLEAMILQDILNYAQPVLRLSTESHFAKKCKYLSEHVEELDQPKYQKYLNSCDAYDNNPIRLIKEGNWNGRIKRMQIIRKGLGLFRRL